MLLYFHVLFLFNYNRKKTKKQTKVDLYVYWYFCLESTFASRPSACPPPPLKLIFTMLLRSQNHSIRSMSLASSSGVQFKVGFTIFPFNSFNMTDVTDRKTKKHTNSQHLTHKRMNSGFYTSLSGP